ncbi:unnamed protein product [Amoebophrya sp. A25]|nr:unnamed protein product [Amoebophrya sp. A25]|eukprot:GSA25T00002743001.1
MGRTTKDKRDIYYRLAKEQGLRARSAFKLLQVNDAVQLFETAESTPDQHREGVTRLMEEDREIVDLSDATSRTRSRLEAEDREIVDVSDATRSFATATRGLISSFSSASGILSQHGGPKNTTTATRPRPSSTTLNNSSSSSKKNTTTVVVDLCAAPGSWTQVLGKHFDHVVAVDLQPMNLEQIAPRQNVSYVYGDITAPETHLEILRKCYTSRQSRSKPKGVENSFATGCADGGCADHVEGSSSTSSSSSSTSSSSPIFLPSTKVSSNVDPLLADLVVMDGAPDVSLIHDFDEYIQHLLIGSSLKVCRRILRPGGNFIAKLFRGPQTEKEVLSVMRKMFGNVYVCKPRASRVSSPECFVVGKGFFGTGPGGSSWTSILSSNLDAGTNGDSRSSAVDSEDESSEQESSEVLIFEGDLDQNGRSTGGGDNETSQDVPARPARPQEGPSHSTASLCHFLQCGARDAPDSDRTYALEEGHVFIDPVQRPLKAFYEEALARKRDPKAVKQGGG